ncbi:MAG: Crp/Fnr family transcriptional regulator [Bacteroidetes bacterium]|nr:Crp/Fnr family transcriptional regulator [Bacteroidota bacterium]MBS1740416.1 Crp/Fnr family transcriptional regulator [Bacteroidota bacterium]MBS1776115.1 Crp/Fnr family transcriptional regulator [Bacteroidota bacterium]
MNRQKRFSDAEYDAVECSVSHQSLFDCLTKDEINMLDEFKSCLTFKKSQQIFNEGNYPLGIYCIDRGKVKLSHSGEDGKMQIVRLATAGNIIGYRALFCNEKYNASAIALDDTSVCFIPKDVFMKVLSLNTQLAQNFIRLLATDLRKAEDHMTELAQRPVRERMAKALIALRDLYGLVKDETTINVALSREEIADIVGTATETTIRLLAELKNEGIISFSGKKISIENMAALEKIAHCYQPSYQYSR